MKRGCEGKGHCAPSKRNAPQSRVQAYVQSATDQAEARARAFVVLGLGTAVLFPPREDSLVRSLGAVLRQLAELELAAAYLVVAIIILAATRDFVHVKTAARAWVEAHPRAPRDDYSFVASWRGVFSTDKVAGGDASPAALQRRRRRAAGAPPAQAAYRHTAPFASAGSTPALRLLAALDAYVRRPGATLGLLPKRLASSLLDPDEATGLVMALLPGAWGSAYGATSSLRSTRAAFCKVRGELGRAAPSELRAAGFPFANRRRGLRRLQRLPAMSEDLQRRKALELGVSLGTKGDAKALCDALLEAALALYPPRASRWKAVRLICDLDEGDLAALVCQGLKAWTMRFVEAEDLADERHVLRQLEDILKGDAYERRRDWRYNAFSRGKRARNGALSYETKDSGHFVGVASPSSGDCSWGHRLDASPCRRDRRGGTPPRDRPTLSRRHRLSPRSAPPSFRRYPVPRR